MQMTTDELAIKELELYNIVIGLAGTIEEKYGVIKSLGIFDQYQLIHQVYASLSENNLEALKRALFLTWYSRTEPSFLTGIEELHMESEAKVIKVVDNRISQHTTDYELDWMIDYYSTWDFAFENIGAYNEFQSRLRRTEKLKWPKYLDNEAMKGRGQMGIYWNSVMLRTTST
jgi:hypothetical protein